MRKHLLTIALGLLGMLWVTDASAQKNAPRAHRIGNINVRVVRGDLMTTPAKAVVQNINSWGPGSWGGKVDRVMMATAGTGYHKQLADHLGQFGDLKTFVARGRKQPGRTAFEHVVFVGDNWRSPLKKVVCNGLECANTEGYPSVAMPAMRFGTMSGVVEKTPAATAAAMVQGIKSFAAQHQGGTSVRDVTIVVHRNQGTIDALNASLASAAHR
jgi:O-acetyl-ADP-ribose deacetylase (regulator of RNase III)